MTMLIIYSLLLIALAYLIGCILGCLARRWFGGTDEPRYVSRNDSDYATEASQPSTIASARSSSLVSSSTDTSGGTGSVAAGAAAGIAASGALAAGATSRDTTSAAANKNAKPSSLTSTDGVVDMVIPDDKKAQAEKADSEGVRPKVLAAARTGGADKLQRIKGVGPKNEEALNDLGVYHFDQIANWNGDEAKWVGSYMAFPGRIEREEWIPQAQGLMSSAAGGPSKSASKKSAAKTGKPKAGETKTSSAGSGPKTSTTKKTASTKSAASKATGDAPARVTQAAISAAAVDLSISKADAGKAAEADAVGKRPKILAAPLGAGKDNLKRISGVGPKNEERLNDLGIFHFAQVAMLKISEAKWIGSFVLNFPGRIEREDWIGQAKLLAQGKETEFSKRVDKGEVGSSKGKK